MNGAPTPAQAAAVLEQIALWRDMGVTAMDVGDAMDSERVRPRWADIRRAMERWLVGRRGA